VNDAELIAAIRDNSELDDPEEVERAAHATLTVLGLRLAGGEPIDLGSQQPTSLGRSLAAVGEGEQFSLDEFYDRVGSWRASGTTTRVGMHAQSWQASRRPSTTTNAKTCSLRCPPNTGLVVTGPDQ
jgi:uncharacterized protein (DUF2267 family)